MTGRLQDRVALVTGAGRGLGATIATGLAREGAHVVVHYHASAAGAEKVADEVSRLGRQAIVAQGDICQWDDVKRLTAAAVERFGRVDVLVNNVGDMAAGQMSWRDITEEGIDHVLAVDIKGTMLMIHEVGSRMLEQGGGSIVNIGSRVVAVGSPRAPQYAAAKYGVIGLTKSYALALAPTVRVNTLGPGFVETETTLGRADWQSGRRERILQQTPLNRIAAPDDVVGPVVFLASDDSRHITGAFLVCDGGLTMIGA
jgi:NAD(P)-dependent dehydrogenase (short-subunit alcohol dehydrogenase family)